MKTAILVIFLFCTITVFAQTNLKHVSMDKSYLSGTITAPEFPSHLGWLNTTEPVKLSDLRGKIVLLDFWTYCCINCMHVLPDLHRLEKKYPGLVVIGIHSAKFSGEKSTANIREAILRYDIGHPVVNDNQFEIWNQYAVRAWPTFYLIDPLGKIATYASGEGVFELFDPVIAEMVSYWDSLKILNHERIKFSNESDHLTHSSPLRFPGKIIADASGNRLFISDSNNDRVLIIDEHGKILDSIGSGNAGFSDGDFSQAAFYRPMGLAFDSSRQFLYISDLQNHAIRRADLRKREVSTILGTGRQTTVPASPESQFRGLNSPWDIAFAGDSLIIAMAGQHQLFTFDLQLNQLKRLAGSGRENITDGPASSAALAQPSALWLSGSTLFFIDSETSSLRCLQNGRVTTLIGKGLFDFGDKNGSLATALLQHPLGITGNGNLLFIADTYNNKIKYYDLDKKQLFTLAGDGSGNKADSSFAASAFNEPNGLCLFNGNLFVCDTDNHTIRVLNLFSRRVSTLNITP